MSQIKDHVPLHVLSDGYRPVRLGDGRVSNLASSHVQGIGEAAVVVG